MTKKKIVKAEVIGEGVNIEYEELNFSYHVVFAVGLDKLVESVQYWQKLGHKPIGGIATYFDSPEGLRVFMQAMVKE